MGVVEVKFGCSDDPITIGVEIRLFFRFFSIYVDIMVGKLNFFIVVGHTHLTRPFDSRINFENRTRDKEMASFLIQINFRDFQILHFQSPGSLKISFSQI